MPQDDDLLSRLGSIAREREREADEELLAPTLTLRDPAAVHEAIVRQALAQTRRRHAPARVRIAFAGVVAAAAAATLLWLSSAQVAPLPEYALLHRGSLEQERGPMHEEVLQLRPNSRLELELKPARDVAGAVQLHVLVQRGPQISALALGQVERSETGSFRAALSAEQQFGTNFGPLTLIALVCRPEVCERAQTALQTATPTDATWQVFRIAAVYAR